MMIEYENGICEWYDLEGQLLVGTKEEYESYCETLNKIWDIAKPTINSNMGTIMIYGTGDEIDKNYSYEINKMFYNSQTYNTIELEKDLKNLWKSHYKVEDSNALQNGTSIPKMFIRDKTK